MNSTSWQSSNLTVSGALGLSSEAEVRIRKGSKLFWSRLDVAFPHHCLWWMITNRKEESLGLNCILRASLVAQMVRICLQCKRSGFDPWDGKIPWRRERWPTPVFLPGEFYGQRSLEGYSLWGHKQLDTTERLTHTHVYIYTYIHSYKYKNVWLGGPASWTQCLRGATRWVPWSGRSAGDVLQLGGGHEFVSATTPGWMGLLL